MNAKLQKAVTPVITSLIFVFYFFLLEGVALDYWDTYIAAPATFLTGKPCTFVDERGRASYEYELHQRLPDDLIDKDSFGIVSKDQRIGAGVIFAPAYLAFGVAGFRLLYAAFGAMAFLFSTFAGRRIFSGRVLPILIGLIVALNPFMLMMNRLNANFIAVAVMAGLLALLLEEKPRWLLIGLVYGALGGIRNEAIMLAPALCLLLAAKENRPGFPLFTAGAMAGVGPYLAWNKFAFGKALIHSSQFADFDGWRPVFPHRFLWWDFDFNGLFNWPFHDQLVRTPHYPFPTYLTLPLTLILCFGTVLIACSLLGLFAQWRKGRRLFGFFVLWIVFSLGLFLFQENWEEPKTTFGALIIPPLGVLMVRGIEWLTAAPSLRRWAVLIVTVLLLDAGVHAARFAHFPADERWYVRFPKARLDGEAGTCLDDEARREWVFFHTDECPEELDFQRIKLTRGNLAPRLYYPLRLHGAGFADEFWLYRPEIFDIWHKIYGPSAAGDLSPKSSLAMTSRK